MKEAASTPAPLVVNKTAINKRMRDGSLIRFLNGFRWNCCRSLEAFSPEELWFHLTVDGEKRGSLEGLCFCIDGIECAFLDFFSGGFWIKFSPESTETRGLLRISSASRIEFSE